MYRAFLNLLFIVRIIILEINCCYCDSCIIYDLISDIRYELFVS